MSGDDTTRWHAVSAGTLLLSDARFPAGGHAHSGGVEPAVTAGIVTDVASLEVFLRGRLNTAGVVAAGLAAAACALGSADPAADGPHADGPHAAGGLGTPNWTWADLDVEADARTPSPAQREASRRQGRALLRAARAAWPEARWLEDLSRTSPAPWNVGEYRGGPHHAVVLGAVAAAAGCAPHEAAQVAAYQAVAGPTSAAVRLLALDPMQATAVLVRLADLITARSRDAAGGAEARGAEGVGAEAGGAEAGGAEGVGAEGVGPVGREAVYEAEKGLAELPYPSAPGLDLLAEAHYAAEVRLFES
jgi:urease accessory protein